MKAIWNVIRWVLGIIVLVIFVTLLTITPLLLSVTTLVTNRETLSTWLSNSGMYSQVSDLAVDRVVDELKKNGLPSKDVKKYEPKIKKALSEDFVEQTVTTVISGVYDFFEGKTESIEIKPQNIDLDLVAKDLIPKEFLKDKQFASLLNSLKPCSASQLQQYEKDGGFKSVEDFCIPPSLNLIKVDDGSGDSLKAPTAITTDNIFQIPDIPQESAFIAKTVFSSFQYAELILFSTLFILLVLFLLITPTRFVKVYAIGAIIFLASLVQLVIWKSAQVLSYASEFLIQNIDLTDVPLNRAVISDTVTVILGDLAKYAAQYSLWIFIFSILMLITTGVVHFFVNKKMKMLPAQITEEEKSKPIVGSEPPKKDLT